MVQEHEYEASCTVLHADDLRLDTLGEVMEMLEATLNDSDHPLENVDGAKTQLWWLAPLSLLQDGVTQQILHTYSRGIRLCNSSTNRH